MREPTVMLRVRLTEREVKQIDGLARELAPKLKRSIPRAAILRALARAGMEGSAQRGALLEQLSTDKVRRGRLPDEPRGF